VAEKSHIPLTDEEKKEIHQNIHLARADVRVMAQRLIQDVWEEK
jgi:hypothetical protein